ncbi:hypothetical protein ACXZEC_000154 [Escherichia coli]|uniref:terminase small subunit-like protein n=1 Tax=Escherichia coli TaxID=562 RepID=UPI0010B8164B|nr:hypothetical protein [Escherichia coli]MDI0761733.1 hypothetical protein [Escherichia coli]GCG29709.1 phage terminase small subunit [Escherichia coli]GCG44667.1 phage terminase small subunit [Escherichia coli]
MTDNLPQSRATPNYETSERPKSGRIGKYNERIATQICLYAARGLSISKIARQPGMPSRETIQRWMLEHPELRQTIAAIRWINATELAAEAIECYDDLTPGSETFGEELDLAKAKAATMLGAARLLDLKIVPPQIQENENEDAHRK